MFIEPFCFSLTDRLTAGLFPSVRSPSSDTLCSMDSLSDDHIEIKVPPSPIPVTITAPDETTPLQHPLQNGTAKLLLHETAPV